MSYSLRTLRSELELSDGTIRIKKNYFSQKLSWKNCWKLSKLLWIEDLKEDCVKISGHYLKKFLRNKPSKSVRAGSGRADSSF